MGRDAADQEQESIDRFCRAASAVYYEIVQASVRQEGQPAMLPTLICPRGRVPSTGEFTDRELDEAEAFLLRLGVIAER